MKIKLLFLTKLTKHYKIKCALYLKKMDIYIKIYKHI